MVRSDSQLAAQITVLNEDYSGSGLTFTLAGTTRTVNSQWFNQVGPDSSLQTTMKKQVTIRRVIIENHYQLSCLFSVASPGQLERFERLHRRIRVWQWCRSARILDLPFRLLVQPK